MKVTKFSRTTKTILRSRNEATYRRIGAGM